MAVTENGQSATQLPSGSSCEVDHACSDTMWLSARHSAFERTLLGRLRRSDSLFLPALGLDWLCRVCQAVQGHELAMLLVMLLQPWLHFSLQLTLL